MEKAVMGKDAGRRRGSIKKGGKSPYQPSVTPLPGQLSEYKQLVLIMRCGCMFKGALHYYIQAQYYIKTSLSDPPQLAPNKIIIII